MYLEIHTFTVDVGFVMFFGKKVILKGWGVLSIFYWIKELYTVFCMVGIGEHESYRLKTGFIHSDMLSNYQMNK